MFAPDLVARAAAFVESCTRQVKTVAVAESCTGGLLSALLTEVPGSSAVFRLGVVTYADTAKTEMIGVSAALLERHGAVSAAVAVAMVEGVLRRGSADLGAAITGIAGPSGGSPAKPVGLVYIAVAQRSDPARVQRFNFGDQGRSQVRMESVTSALGLLEEFFRP